MKALVGKWSTERNWPGFENWFDVEATRQEVTIKLMFELKLQRILSL